jgi:hypothetical protein
MADLIEASSAPVKAVREEPTADLSAEIIKSVEKWPEDRVTCRRIGANTYRCNWWSAADKSSDDNPRMEGLLVTTHRVRKSRFLSVTKSTGGLVIIERNNEEASN